MQMVGKRPLRTPLERGGGMAQGRIVLLGKQRRVRLECLGDGQTVVEHVAGNGQGGHRRRRADGREEKLLERVAVVDGAGIEMARVADGHRVHGRQSRDLSRAVELDDVGIAGDQPHAGGLAVLQVRRQIDELVRRLRLHVLLAAAARQHEMALGAEGQDAVSADQAAEHQGAVAAGRCADCHDMGRLELADQLLERLRGLFDVAPRPGMPSWYQRLPAGRTKMRLQAIARAILYSTVPARCSPSANRIASGRPGPVASISRWE